MKEGIEVTIDVKFDIEQMTAILSPEQINAVMAGIARLLCAGAKDAESDTEN